MQSPIEGDSRSFFDRITGYNEPDLQDDKGGLVKYCHPLNQPQLPGYFNCLGTIMHIQFAINNFIMRSHRIG